jgi:hypothetical protein
MMVTIKEAMAEVNEYAMTDAGRAFRKLVAVWINKLRAKNDTAPPEEFMKNQGAIRELKLMHKGIGPKIRTSEWDGGFGS